ncbi:ABC transporter ATP-binding protein [Castellaniella caeni]
MSRQDTIEIDALGKQYGSVAALYDINATIPAGQVTGLLGHNGAGKSTLIKLILGLIKPTRGQIRVLGESPSGVKAHTIRQHLGYLPESVSFYTNLTGAEVIDYFAQLKRVSTPVGRKLLERVGLGPAQDRRVGGYSKGMRQRLGLAQALLSQPDVVLLDEPTSGLDPQATRELYGIIDDLRAAGRCVLISSHLLAELEPHIDRALILREGRLLASGSLGELQNRARLPSTIRLQLIQDGSTDALPPCLQALDARRTIRDGNQVEIHVSDDEKMPLLRDLLNHPRIANVRITEPSLSSLYDWLGANHAQGAA